MTIAELLGSYISVFPVSETVNYFVTANHRQGPFFGPRSMGLSPWDNHEDVVTCDGFTFPATHPDSNASYPMIVPCVTGKESVLEDNNSLLTRWENNVADFRFTAVSPDGKKAAVINNINSPATQWAVAVFNVLSLGDYEASLDSETDFPVWPMSLRMVPYAIALDNSGNVYLAGWGQPYNNSFERLTIAKFNAAGTLQWQSNAYGEGDAVFPPTEGSYPGDDLAQWGTDTDWDNARYAATGPVMGNYMWYTSKLYSSVQFETEFSLAADFSTTLCTKVCTASSTRGVNDPLRCTFNVSWAELGFSEANPLINYGDPVYIYTRTRCIIDSVTGAWSNKVVPIYFYRNGTMGEWEWDTAVTSGSFSTDTVWYPRHTPCEMQIIGTDLHLAVGGQDRVFTGTLTGATPNYTSTTGRVYHFTVALTGGTITKETADTPGYWEGGWWRSWSTTNSYASIEMIVDGSDIYLCPTVWNGWNLGSYPAFVLVKHNGAWSRLHLHTPAGVYYWENTATSHHIFLLDGEPVFIGQGKLNSTDTTATCWIHCTFDPTTQDQTMSKTDMPTFTTVVGGVTYTYGYWGGNTYTVGFDGKHIFVNGQEDATDVTQRVYMFGSCDRSVVHSFPWMLHFQLCHKKV